MSFIKTIFNKHIDDLEISDLNDFFEVPQEETSILEFKSGEVEIHDIYKEIAAFLNTEGGLLIIGSPRETTKKLGKSTITTCSGELTHSKFRNKDWLYQKIASNIVPAPVGLKIFEHITSQGAVFILDIPQSTMPPHQCSSDGRYYIRMERDAKPAPHGFVQALFQKRRLPQLDCILGVKSISRDTDNVTVSLINKSNVPADKVSFIVEIYNVNSIESDFNIVESPDVLGYKYTISKNTDQVLVSVISMNVEFTSHHDGDEYIIFAGFWSKESDFDFKFWTYNPTLKRVVTEDYMDYEKISFIEEVNRVNKKKST